jgi:hypothetical protein
MSSEELTTLSTVCGGRERDDFSADAPSLLGELKGAVLVLEPSMALLPAPVPASKEAPRGRLASVQSSRAAGDAMPIAKTTTG